MTHFQSALHHTAQCRMKLLQFFLYVFVCVFIHAHTRHVCGGHSTICRASSTMGDLRGGTLWQEPVPSETPCQLRSPFNLSICVSMYLSVYGCMYYVCIYPSIYLSISTYAHIHKPQSLTG